MPTKIRGWAVALIGSVASLLMGAAPGPPLSLAAVDQLEAGLWQLDVKGRAPKLVCVGDAMALLQIEHDQPGCSHFVIANQPKDATIHYSCQRAGWGRTTLRIESSTLAQVQTQGIAHNLPFDFSAEARRVGACSATAAARR